MKNILNRMSEDEKQAILEQHKGGKTINTEKFARLLESKLGDVKPLTEQTLPQTTPTPTQKITELGDVTGDLKGKTVNFYEDEANKYLRFTLKIIKIIKEEFPRLQIVMDWGTSGQKGENPDYFYFFCEDGNFISNRGSEQETLFSNNFAKELKKRFCDVSAGGAEVPAADFVQP